MFRLGGCESNIDWRFRWDSSTNPASLRISVGLEAAEDLIADLKQGFEKVKAMVELAKPQVKGKK